MNVLHIPKTGLHVKINVFYVPDTFFRHMNPPYIPKDSFWDIGFYVKVIVFHVPDPGFLNKNKCFICFAGFCGVWDL